MPTLREYRHDIAAAVAGIGDPELIGYDYAPADVVTPALIVEPEEIDWRATPGSTFRRGGAKWTLSAFVLVSPADAENATRQTDAFFDESANDLKDAIEKVAPGRIEVIGADRWGEYPLAARTLHGFRLIVEILAT